MSTTVKEDVMGTQSSTFVVTHPEMDHALFNMIRGSLARDVGHVDVVGYDIPHALEQKINLTVSLKQSSPDTPRRVLDRTMGWIETELSSLLHQIGNQ